MNVYIANETSYVDVNAMVRLQRGYWAHFAFTIGPDLEAFCIAINSSTACPAYDITSRHQLPWMKDIFLGNVDSTGSPSAFTIDEFFFNDRACGLRALRSLARQGK